MAASIAESSFPFIVSSGPRVPKDPAVRTLIRKQAMKDVGMARKRKGNYGRINLRQPPAFEETDVQEESVASSSESATLPSGSGTESPPTSNSSTDEATCDEIVPRKPTKIVRRQPVTVAAWTNLPVPPAAAPPSLYEAMRTKYHIDIPDLSILTSFNVGKGAMYVISSDTSRLTTLLGRHDWSYLDYVPSRYGLHECLTAAVDCVAAKVRSVLTPSNAAMRTAVMNLYAVALRHLQCAIADARQCLEPEVLCAIELLSIHELLDPSKESAWSHHIKGSTRLVRHRTPARFATDFEKALFVGHTGPVVSEALLENQHCYLAEPEWTKLYLSLAQEGGWLTNRSMLSIKARMRMFTLPGLWRDMHYAVLGDDLFNPLVMSDLEKRMRVEHTALLEWTEEYKAHCVRMSFAYPPESELSLRRELFGSALECLAIVKRLLAAVCESERFKLESEAQALAHLLVDLQKQPSPKHSWLFSGHEIGVAHTIMITEKEWDEDLSDRTIEEQLLASRARYDAFQSTLRMSD